MREQGNFFPPCLLVPQKSVPCLLVPQKSVKVTFMARRKKEVIVKRYDLGTNRNTLIDILLVIIAHIIIIPLFKFNSYLVDDNGNLPSNP
jgi:hypothetical protein